MMCFALESRGADSLEPFHKERSNGDGREVTLMEDRFVEMRGETAGTGCSGGLDSTEIGVILPSG